MARQTNILSFDEVKQGVRSRPSSEYATGSRTARRQESRSYRPSSAASPSYEKAASSSRSAVAPRSSASSRRLPSDPLLGIADAPSFTGRVVRAEASVADRYGFPSDRSASAGRSSAGRGIGATPRGARGGSEARRADEGRDDDPAQEASGRREESRLASLKRARAKSKAGRAFSKQFGDGDSAASQGGPRAAVYKGEMGAKHRQAARMQDKTSSRAAAKRGAKAGAGSSLVSSPKFIASMTVAVCLALSCLFLYPSVQQYYQSVRERDRLAAEYAALVERNSAIEGSVASLQTNSGIENAAHEQLGWVKQGEQTAKVSGLSSSEEEGAAVHANIVSGSIAAPETWYSPILDPLFGVE